MKEIILDCKEMSSKEKAHEYIMKKMNFPDYYGKNLDALYDILSTYDKEVYVKFINFESLFKKSWNLLLLSTYSLKVSVML